MPSEQDLSQIIEAWEQQQWQPRQYDINKLYVAIVCNGISDITLTQLDPSRLAFHAYNFSLLLLHEYRALSFIAFDKHLSKQLKDRVALLSFLISILSTDLVEKLNHLDTLCKHLPCEAFPKLEEQKNSYWESLLTENSHADIAAIIKQNRLVYLARKHKDDLLVAKRTPESGSSDETGPASIYQKPRLKRSNSLSSDVSFSLSSEADDESDTSPKEHSKEITEIIATMQKHILKLREDLDKKPNKNLEEHTNYKITQLERLVAYINKYEPLNQDIIKGIAEDQLLLAQRYIRGQVLAVVSLGFFQSTTAGLVRTATTKLCPRLTV